MKTSFDEIRKIAFRALKSAGAAPGIDDDGGWACAWLEAAGYPGLRMLADFLDKADGQECFAGADSVAGDLIEAGGRSAIILAGPIVEYAATRQGATTVRDVQHAPYLIAHAARQSEAGTHLTISPEQEGVGNITIEPGGEGYAGLQSRVHDAVLTGLEADDDAYARVYAYSLKILVPQSETSLLSGAGAGLTDND